MLNVILNKELYYLNKQLYYFDSDFKYMKYYIEN